MESIISLLKHGNKEENKMLNKLGIKVLCLSLVFLVISNLGVQAEMERKFREYTKSDEPTVDFITTTLVNKTRYPILLKTHGEGIARGLSKKSDYLPVGEKSQWLLPGHSAEQKTDDHNNL